MWMWMDMQADECSSPALMCVDRGVLVGGGQGLGQGLSVSKLSAALVWIVGAFPLRFVAGEPGRSSTFRTFDRECSPHLPLFAGELLVGTHAAPSPVALFAHMVLSIAPAVASTCASYVPLIPRSARSLHNKGPPGRMRRTATLLSADCTGARSCSLPLSAFSFTGPLGGATSS